MINEHGAVLEPHTVVGRFSVSYLKHDRLIGELSVYSKQKIIENII